MKRLALVFPLLLLACATPVTVVQTVDDRSRLLIESAPAGAKLFLDGKLVGEASAYSGNPKVLLVEPGVHLVEIKLGERLLASQKLFFGGGEQRRLAIPSEGNQ
jgi:hypothetical protein